MTDKQKAFIDEYLIDYNATRAYKEIYKGVKNDNVAAVNASNLLRNPNVKEYYDEKVKAENKKELSVALMSAFSWDNKVLIEKAINAREIECSVTGNAVTAAAYDDEERVTAYVPGEIIPTHDFYDYDAKYNDPNGANLLIPANLKEENLEKIRKVAVAAYKALDLSGLSRIDFLIDRESGQLYLNEINTMPGFTQISMFPKMCEAAGLPFEELTELLIQQALKMYKAKSILQTQR